jgi:CheY-like chemotaxis protein
MMKPVIQDAKPALPYEGVLYPDSGIAIGKILKRTNELVREGNLSRAYGELTAAYRETKENYKKGIIVQNGQEKSLSPKMDLTSLPLKPIEALIGTISSSKQKHEERVRSIDTASGTKSEKSREAQQDKANRNIEFNFYREALEKAWLTGNISDDDRRQLHELRAVLEISDSEHEMLEKELLQNRKKGESSATNPESQRLQNELLCIKDEEPLDKILVIDDEAEYLDVLAASMMEDGFDVTAVTTSDEAYILLQEYVPDLILCDINLKTSTMDGFTFYEKIQRVKHLQKVPFVFLTGIMDDGLAQKGREMGADDYLMKPVSRKTLMPALRGKIRRFKQLKGN